jgi:hypothetical protein
MDMVGSINSSSQALSQVLQTSAMSGQAQMSIFKQALAIETQIDMALVAQIAGGQTPGGGGVDLLA